MLSDSACVDGEGDGERGRGGLSFLEGIVGSPPGHTVLRSNWIKIGDKTHKAEHNYRLRLRDTHTCEHTNTNYAVCLDEIIKRQGIDE